MKTTHAALQKLALNLPLRLIDHEGRPFLRRYYLTTVLGVRVYLHHFVDSDPDGLHNHPAKYGFSVLLSGSYQEERRWCQIPAQRDIRFCNFLGPDTLHRVLLFRDGAGSPLTVWTLFFHTRKVMNWATIKDKGMFKQYSERFPNFAVEDGHSLWWKDAKKGWQLLDDNGNLRSIPL